jgi:hypothetical protein
VAFGSTVANHPPLLGQQIQPGKIVPGTVGFYVPRDITSQATLVVRTSTGSPVGTYLLTYSPPHELKPAEVTLLAVGTTQPAEGAAEVVVTLTIFNPNAEALSISPNDLYFIFSHTEPNSEEIPIGPQVLPTTINGATPSQFVVPGGQEVQIEMRTSWDGSPYAGIVALGYKYAVQLVQVNP